MQTNAQIYNVAIKCMGGRGGQDISISKILAMALLQMFTIRHLFCY